MKHDFILNSGMEFAPSLCKKRYTKQRIFFKNSITLALEFVQMGMCTLGIFFIYTHLIQINSYCKHGFKRETDLRKIQIIYTLEIFNLGLFSRKNLNYP